MYVNYHYSTMIIKEREKELLKKIERNRLIHVSKAVKKRHRFTENLAHYIKNFKFPWFQKESLKSCECQVT